jgi:hypothetical protein
VVEPGPVHIRMVPNALRVIVPRPADKPPAAGTT